MRKMAILSFLAALILIIAGGVIACAPAMTYDEEAVRAYADTATETTLQGLSEDDLAKYTEYGNAGFKEAATQQVFNDTAQQLESQIGTYVSKEFVKIGSYKDYILVYYKAEYTKGEVTVRMVFDQDHLVAGQWFE